MIVSPVPLPPQSAPPDIAGLTEEYRQQQLALGKASLFYFIVAICGFGAEDPDTGISTLTDYHKDMCKFLEGSKPHYPYNRALVCCFRGGSKSLFTRLYGLWRALYIENFAVLLLSNSATNAATVHYATIYDLLVHSPRAEYIRWLFQHRFPPGLAGTNSDRLKLIQSNPAADPAFSHAGIESRLEGKHPNLVIIDDAEGADAETSDVANEEAYSLYQRAIPLLPDQRRSQIIVVGTPWGRAPLVYRLRDQYGWKTDADNATCPLKVFWRPIIDPYGKPYWPDRFPHEVIEILRRERMFPTQCLLKRSSAEDTLFEMKKVKEAFYTHLGPNQDRLRYKGFKFDPDAVDEEGYVTPKSVEATVTLKQMRFYVHFDPLHKTKEGRAKKRHQRPAKAAIAVVGVAPDYHAFVVDHWLGDGAELAEQARQLFRMYCKWSAYKVTWEVTGAQWWLLSHVKMMEESHKSWARPQSSALLGAPTPLPRMSARMEQDEKANEAKEKIFMERLSPWISHGALHLHDGTDHQVFYDQLEQAANEQHEVDLVDCLAQGASIWKPPAGDVSSRAFADRRGYVEGFIKGTAGIVGRVVGRKLASWRR